MSQDDIKPCICSHRLAPVCGYDGNTYRFYDNACFMECDGNWREIKVRRVADDLCPEPMQTWEDYPDYQSENVNP